MFVLLLLVHLNQLHIQNYLLNTLGWEPDHVLIVLFRSGYILFCVTPNCIKVFFQDVPCPENLCFITSFLFHFESGGSLSSRLDLKQHVWPASIMKHTLINDLPLEVGRMLCYTFIRVTWYSGAHKYTKIISGKTGTRHYWTCHILEGMWFPYLTPIKWYTRCLTIRWLPSGIPPCASEIDRQKSPLNVL